MSFARPIAQNVRAGVGVLCTLAACGLLLAGVLWVQGQQHEQYTVSFTPVQGVYGIKAGSAVRVGGLVKGAVTGVRPLVEHGTVVAYLVDFTLDRSVTLYRATRIQALGDAFGGESALDIVDIGRGRMLAGVQPLAAREVRPVAPGEVFVASDPGEFDSLVGPGHASKLRVLADRFRALHAPVMAMAEDAPRRVAAVREEWSALTTAMRGDVEAWRAHWDTLVHHAERAVATIGMGDGAAPDAVTPNLRALRDDLAAIDVSARAPRVERVKQRLARAMAALDSLQAQGFAIRSALNDADDGIGFAAADFAIAGQELGATTREVLANPWRLFARPNAEQRADALRVDDARIFAQAATEFEAAVAAIQHSLKEDGEVLAHTPQLAELLATRLHAAALAFDGAVARFANVLLGEPGTHGSP